MQCWPEVWSILVTEEEQGDVSFHLHKQRVQDTTQSYWALEWIRERCFVSIFITSRQFNYTNRHAGWGGNICDWVPGPETAAIHQFISPPQHTCNKVGFTRVIFKLRKLRSREVEWVGHSCSVCGQPGSELRSAQCQSHVVPSCLYSLSWVIFTHRGLI